MVKLINDTISKSDITDLIKWLGETNQLTKGPQTLKFEDEFSYYLNNNNPLPNYSTFVNSGSSANLLMLAAAIEAGLLRQGDKVGVPAVSWATDLAPVMQLGLEPVLIDCNLDDFSLDLDHLEKVAKKLRGLIVVYVLGLVPDMDRLLKIVTDYNILLLEDCCEALGSTYKDKKLGTFGLMSSFSFYFGHHISTIEGGMVYTQARYTDELLKAIRSHGWGRDWNSGSRESMKTLWQVDDFQEMYTFYYPGFNIRSTDLQAYIGLLQIKKLNKIVDSRYRNYKFYCELLDQPINDRGIISNFAFPYMSKNRANLVKELTYNYIETRPLICGNMANQPFYIKKYGPVNLPNAERVHNEGMYLPNHPDLTESDIKKIVDIIKNNE